MNNFFEKILNKIPFSLKMKITFWYMGFMTGLVILFLTIIFYISDNIIRNSIFEDLKTTVNYVFTQIDYSDDELDFDESIEILRNNIEISIYNKDKEFIYGSALNDFDFEDSSFQEDIVKTVRRGNEKWYVYENRKEIPGYGDIWIRGIVPSSIAERAVETIISISLIILPFFLIFSGINGYIITKNGFKPIEKIRLTAEKINAGNDLSQRINLGKRKDELHTLANTFDTMFNRLQNSFENEVQFTSDVSHELRTPISVIISQSEYALNHTESVEKMEKSLKSILNESVKMSQMISQLLTLAKMDKGHQKLNLENVNLSELMEIIIETQQINADKKNIKIISSIKPDIIMPADEILIMRLFINLITNAVNYGKENGYINIELFKNNNKIIGKIADNGIGIAKENINKIWTRFYQVDSSRTSDSSGLGLSMVKWIVEAHNGNISVKSELDKGTIFTVEFPL